MSLRMFYRHVKMTIIDMSSGFTELGFFSPNSVNKVGDDYIDNSNEVVIKDYQHGITYNLILDSKYTIITSDISCQFIPVIKKAISLANSGSKKPACVIRFRFRFIFYQIVYLI